MYLSVNCCVLRAAGLPPEPRRASSFQASPSGIFLTGKARSNSASRLAENSSRNAMVMLDELLMLDPVLDLHWLSGTEIRALFASGTVATITLGSGSCGLEGMQVDRTTVPALAGGSGGRGAWSGGLSLACGVVRGQLSVFVLSGAPHRVMVSTPQASPAPVRNFLGCACMRVWECPKFYAASICHPSTTNASGMHVAYLWVSSG